MQGTDDTGVVSLVIDASGLRQGSTEAQALGKRIIDSFKAIEVAASSVTGSVATSGAGIVKSLGDTNRFLGQIERSLNPLAAAANKAQKEMERLIGIMGGSNIEAATRARNALELQAQKVIELNNAVSLASKENKILEATYRDLERSFQSAVNSLSGLVAKYQPATASAKQMTGELASLNAAYKAELVTETNYIALQSKIINSYNEGAVAAQRMAEARARMIASSRAEQNAQTAQLGIQGITGPVAGPSFTRDIRQQMERAQEIADFEKQIDREILQSRQQRLAREAAAQKSATNQMIATLKEYQTAEEQANKERFKFAQQIAPSMNIAQHRLNEQLKDTGLNTRVAQYAMTNFAFQVNDVVSGLAMGQEPFRIFAQQAGQIVQIFQQIGRQNIGQFFRDIRTSVVNFGAAVGTWLITPVGLATTALALLGIGIASVISYAFTAESRMRSFGVTLKAMGTDSLESAKGLNKFTNELINTGTAAEDAIKAVNALTRIPGINPSQIGNLSILARNISTARGIDLPTAAADIGKAIAGGADELIRYAQVLGVRFLPAEQKAIESAILHKDKILEAKVALEAITRTFDGAFISSLSNIEKSINNLTANWRKMLQGLSESVPFQFVINRLEAIAELLNQISRPGGGVPELPANIEARLPRQPGDVAFAPIPGAGVNSVRDLSVLTSHSTPQARIGELFPTFATRLNAWLGSLSKEDRDLISITSGFAVGGHAPNSLHYQGLAVDVQGVTKAAEEALARYQLSIGVRHPGHLHIEPIEVPPSTSASAGARVSAGRVFTGTAPGTSPAIPTGSNVEIARQTTEINLRNTSLGLYARELSRAQAAISATTEAEQRFKGSTPEDELKRQEFVTNAVTEATRRFDDELQKGIRVENLRTKGALDTGKAFGENTEAGLKAAAAAEARNRALTEGISFEEAYRQALARGAAEAVRGAAEQIASQAPVLAGQSKIAEAAKISGQAEHDARVEAEAAIVTQKALDAARASGIPIVEGMTKALTDQAKAQILLREANENAIKVQKDTNQTNDAIKVIELQRSLQGQTTEEITRQVAILQKKNELERDTTGLSLTQKATLLDNTTRLQEFNVKLAETQRAQGRVDELFRGIGDTISRTLGDTIDGLFDPTKRKKFSETAKTFFNTIQSQILQSTFIRPLTGSILQLFGASPNATSGFGSLFGGGGGGIGGGDIFSGIGKLFDSSSSSGSFFDKLFSGGGGTAGRDFGSAFPEGGTGAGIFGSEFSFGDLFGGAGTGFGVGGLLSGLLGGNRLLGSIGGGIGGLAGTVLPSLLGFSLGPLGGILGGALGGLFGLFGNKKPPNASGGGNINLATGKSFDPFAGGNAEIDQAVQGLINNVSQATQALLKASGDKITGNLLIQHGVNTGITVDSNLAGWEGRFSLGKDPGAAGATIIRAIAATLPSLSSTMRTIIDKTQDFSQLGANLQFGEIYDNIQSAFDSAFANLDENTIVGPFATALEQISNTFDELTLKAQEFGLATEAIAASFEEANRRLRVDFTTSIVRATEEARGRGFINQLLDVRSGSDALHQEATALGMTDPETARFMDELFTAQVNSILGSLTSAELEQVSNEFVGLDETIVQLAQAMAALNEEIEVLDSALQEFRDSLVSGTLSGLSDLARIPLEMSNFNTAVAAGNQEDIIRFGSSALEFSTAAFGQGPQTAELRNEILAAVDSVLAGLPGFAEGTMVAPQGWSVVGEKGPELMYQPGGGTIFPNNILKSQTATNGDMNAILVEMRRLSEIMRIGVGEITQRQDVQIKQDAAPVFVAPARQKV